MPLGGGIALGLGSIGSAVIGGEAASSAQQSATNARNQALRDYLNVNVPDPAQQQLILQRYQQTGYLDPSIETAINQTTTAQNSIALDPATRAAQMKVLAQYQDIADNQGEDAIEKNQIQQGINAVNANQKGQTDAILQNAAARGVGGSGASLAAELEGAQAGANNASQNAMSAQALAQQRVLQALQGEGSMAGQIHSQDYNQALNEANAEDAINRFNAQEQNAAMGANTTAKNQAQAYNVETGQRISDQNTGVSNFEQQYNKNLLQNNFNNQMALASGEANAEAGVANQANLNAQTVGNMWGNISSGLAGAAGSVYKSGQSSAPSVNNYYGGSGPSSSTLDSEPWGGNETDPNAEDFVGPTQS